MPWRGFFDLINRADVFVFYDDVQYDKHGWRNRNRIKTAQGTQWLTIPVLAKGNVDEKVLVKDVRIANQPWAKKHIATLKQSYARAPFFKQIWTELEPLWLKKHELLAELTIETTLAIAKLLGIDHVRFARSSELGIGGERTERLVSIVKHFGADEYLSGPSAKSYIEEERFRAANVRLEYIRYDYAPYEQLHPPYDPAVSILDLLFMKGDEARDIAFASPKGAG